MKAISVKDIPSIEHDQLPVITTSFLAQLYGTTAHSITKNHRSNADRFIIGKHYYKVVGDELATLRITLSDLQIHSKTRSQILWTERGAARHAKMLETDMAWEVFERLEDSYFNKLAKNEPVDKSSGRTTVDDRTPLRSLVNRIMAKYGTTYQAVYRLIHREFGVQHIEELTPKQTAEAMEYLAAKVIEGEFIGKTEEITHKPASDEYRYHVRVTVYDNLMSSCVEILEIGHSMRDVAFGVASDLGYRPNAFTHIPVDTKKIQRLY